MNTVEIPVPNSVSRFVKNVIVLEDKNSKRNLLPFYADGYPGIVYQQRGQEAFLFPKMKKLTDFFLYGQTIKPIEILIEGSYRLIVFQLFPFASKILFDINPKELNDECYDLTLVTGANAKQLIELVDKQQKTEEQIDLITDFLSELIKKTASTKSQRVLLAINLILSSRGTITVKALTEQLCITERTLQRQFVEYVGLSPKQFAKIIQFDSSLNQVANAAFTKLSEVVYENGYADQSHFIRSFKKFAGKKPSQLKPK